MDDISDLLRETIAAAQPEPVPVSQQKIADVKAATDTKKVELGGIPSQDTFNNAAIMRLTGAGIDSATPLERDLALLPPDQLAQKYGAERANTFNAAVGAASFKFTNERTAYRTAGRATYDALSGGFAGIVNPITQIGALGTGALSPVIGAGPGVKAAQVSQHITNAIEGSQSPGLQARREAMGQLEGLQARDEAKQHELDLRDAGADPALKQGADLRHIGRDATNTLDNSFSDTALLGDQAAQAAGGLITMGPEAKVLGLAAKAVVPTAVRKGIALAAEMDRGLEVPSLARAIDATGQALPSDMQVVGGAMNAGGAYTGTVNDSYSTLTNQGVSPDEAADRANKAGLTAASIAGVGGAAATKFAEKFERNPLASTSFGDAISNIGRQTADQAAQSVAAQAGQNVGQKAFVDPNTDWSQGIGAALASGALNGGLTAGALQAPGLVGHGLVSTVKATGEKIVGKGEATQTANENASPYSTDTVSKAGAEMAQTAQAPATEEALKSAATLVKAGDEVDAQDGTKSDNGSKIEALGKKILDYGKYDPSELASNPSLSDDVKATLSKTTDRANAALALAQDVNDKGAHTPEGLAAASELSKQIDGMSRVVNSDPDAFAAMPDDHPAAKLISKFDDLHTAITQTPSVVEAFNKLKGLTDEQVSKLIKPVTEDSLDTRQGQQNVDNALLIAAHAPEKANLDVNNQIMEMANRGKLELKPDQLMALKASSALIQADRTASEAQAKLGNKPLNKVTDNALTAPGESPTGHNSAARYTKSIYDAMKAGNVEHAQTTMGAFGHFVQHMQNKVAALNTHYEQGTNSPKISFDAWNPTKLVRYPTTGNERAYVHTHDKNSIEYAQTVAHEAQRLTDHYNNLSKAFPELKAGDFEHTKLHPNLQGKPEDVVRDHKDGTLVRPETPKDRSSLVQKAKPTETYQDYIEAEHDVSSADHSRSSVSTTDQGNPDAQAKGRGEEAAVRDDEHTPKGDETSRETVGRSVEADRARREAKFAQKEKAVATPGSEALRASEELPDQGAKAETPKIEATPENHSHDEKSTEAQPEELSRSEKIVQGAEAPKTTKELAPNLVHSEDGAKGTNWFHKAYKVVQNSSRLLTDSKPVNTLMKAFKSHDALETHMGSERKLPLAADVSQAYRAFLKNAVPALRETLDKRLEAKLNGKANTKGENAGKTPADMLNEGKFNEFASGKVTNLVERQADGSFKYNDGLANKAILAGLQWLLTYTDHAAPNDAESLAKVTGLAQDDPQLEGMLDDFKGMTKLQAVRSLAEKIEQYWGVKGDNEVSKDYADGVSTAMAAEILQALTDTKIGGESYLNTHELSYINKEGKPRNLSMHERNLYVTDPETGVKDPLFKDPRLIDDAVLTDPPHRDYYTGDKIKDAKTQLHNPSVDLTKSQRAMIQAAQNIEYFVNEHMHNLYQSLGRDKVLDLFGGGADLQKRIDAKTINTQDAKSLAGKNQTIGSGYDYLTTRVDQMRAMGHDLQKVGARFEFGVAVNGRLMMQGPENPQAAKIVREVFLPTWSNLDLNKSENLDLFKTAIPQAIGIKINQLLTDDIRTQVDTLLNGKLKNVVDMLGEHLNGKNLDESFVNEIKSALGEDLTPNALHALQEYARFKDSPDKSNFRTGLYIEADGVSNGVANALHFFTGGEFNADQIANMRKTGWLPGQDRTMNDHRAHDGTDLYKAVSNRLSAITSEQRKALPDGHPIKAQMDNLFHVMEALLKKGDVTYDQDGGVVLARGVTKNPVTITFYGSEAKGIAQNIAGELFSEIYKRLSKVAADPDKSMSAMFDGDEEKTNAFFAAFEKLMSHTVDGKPGELSLAESGAKRSAFYPENWKITKDEFDAVTHNVRRLLVDPMRKATTDVLGSNVMTSKDLLQKATQAQSVALSEVFKQKVQAMKEANGGKFPSESDLQQALKELHEQFPLIDTSDQRFFPVKRASEDSNGVFGRGLNDEFETNGEFNAPADAGVSGLATMNQGMGDGRMIQTMLNNGVKGLPVFDGFNMALDQAKAGSQQANRAVDGTWRDGNPLKVVHESFSTFMESVRNGLLDDPKIVQALIKAMYPEFKQAQTKPEDVFRMLHKLESDLQSTSKEIDARHQAISETHYHVDQMAGAQSPHENKGRELPTTDGEIANALNTRVREILTGKKAEGPNLAITAKDLSSILSTAKFLPQQLGLMRRILGSGALEKYQIVSGTLNQIAEFRARGNLSMPETANASTKGFLDPVNKIMHLISPTAETLLHESIHAATFQTLLDYYEGRNGNDLVKDSVSRLEALREQFLNPKNFDGLPDSYFDASKAIIDAQDGTPLGKAKSLNEFMAWVLANKDLAKVAKGTTVDSLVQIAKDVWTSIKKMLFGNYAPKVGDDLYSNLVFHTSVLTEIQARSQPTIEAESRELSLMQNVYYGTDQRLSDINEKFDTMFGRYLKPQDPRAQVTARKNALQPVIDSAHLSAIANQAGFAMTQQAARTFRRTVQLLALNSKLNPASLSKMTELYRHAIEHLTPEMLVDKTDADPQRALNTAQDKLDLLLGHAGVKYDAEGGSSLMPVFMGLALVDDGLRAALRDLPLPKSVLNESGTLDARIENMTQRGMDALSRSFSNQGKAENVRDAVDNMTHFMADDALKDQTYFDVMSTAPSRSVNWANDAFNGWIKKGADALYDKTGKIINDPKSTEISKKITNVGKFIASLASEERTEHLAEGVISFMNKLDGKHNFREIIGDIIGRTERNAPVFDLIKAVRTMVAQTRQQFREHVPSTISKQFSGGLSEESQSLLHRALAKTDAAALMEHHSLEDTLKFVSDPKARASEVSNLETYLKGEDPKHWDLVKAKADQLANHMLSDAPGSNLLSNAEAVAHLLLEKKDPKRAVPSAEYVKSVDRLTTLYALDKLSPETQQAVSKLSKDEAKGMNYVLSYLNGQRKDETTKSTGMARFNSYKGYIPESPQDGVSLVIAKKSDTAKMLAQSYTQIGDYAGSRLDPSKEGRAYFLLPASARAAFSEGIMQNVNQTAGGADKSTGFSTRHTAGRITNPADVAQIAKFIGREGATKENLRPIFNEHGRVVAFERMVDPNMMTALNKSSNISKMLGVWRGRQVEEHLAQGSNEHLVDALHKVYTETMKDPSRANEFIDLWDPSSYKNDKVISDAISLMPPEIKQYIKDTFGTKFLVQKNLVNDAIGYRQASIGDAWTGNSRWSPQVQQKVQHLAMGVFGNDAYKILVNAEANWQNIIKEAKNTIVVKSLIVPATNFISNIYQLVVRGVPVADMVKNLPKMISEANAYTEGRLQKIKAEGELRVAEGSHDISGQLKLKAKIQAIEDGFKRLSIYPLIKAGEFGAISSAGISPEDMMMTGGKMDKFFSSLVNMLPESMQTAGRYALVTRDTALYRGLQKSVEYGDFLGKALYYKHLIDKKGMDPDKAQAKATEEFVHFDRLPGRGRGYLDTFGMAWFFNHKLRSSKIALSMIRDNPLQSLLSTHLSHVGSVDIETPIQVNFFSKLMNGRLPYALGPGMAFKAPFLNPWVNLYDTIIR